MLELLFLNTTVRNAAVANKLHLRHDIRPDSGKIAFNVGSCLGPFLALNYCCCSIPHAFRIWRRRIGCYINDYERAKGRIICATQASEALRRSHPRVYGLHCIVGKEQVPGFLAWDGVAACLE
jgi:hypothetical protein